MEITPQEDSYRLRQDTSLPSQQNWGVIRNLTFWLKIQKKSLKIYAFSYPNLFAK